MGRHRTDRTAPLRADRYRRGKQEEGWRQQGFLLPPDVFAGLEALATARGVSKATLVCELVRAALDDAMAGEP